MKIERMISKYSKKSEELIEEISINNIELQILKNIFNPPSSDQAMYNPYEIKKAESVEIDNFVHIEYDFENYSYYLECFEIE